jgi:hypothetical protein
MLLVKVINLMLMKLMDSGHTHTHTHTHTYTRRSVGEPRILTMPTGSLAEFPNALQRPRNLLKLASNFSLCYSKTG